MSDLLGQVTQYIQTYLGHFIHVNTEMDTLLVIAAIIVVILAVLMITYYTVKKIIINLILGYAALYAVGYFLHISILPTYLMIGLMALFGPIPVVIATLWHYFM